MSDVKEPPVSIQIPDKSSSFYFACQQYAIHNDHPDYPALLMGSCVFHAIARCRLDWVTEPAKKKACPMT